MNQRLQECLTGKQESFALPFLWLHGEPKERVREEILAIKNSGLTQFCAESRPYEKFCCDEWWDDFGFILQTARELDMRVWLLDDRHFPTSYANGYLEDESRAHLRKKLIRECQTEVVGPMKRAKVWVGGGLKRQEEKILQVIAYRHLPGGERLDADSAVDLTDRQKDGMVCWDVPDGVWRVCVLIETVREARKSDRASYFIDMLNPESCHAMIDAVYEPHYEHFKEYFGNTFVGFFSDEPGFRNCCGSYNTLGKMFEWYPWRADLPDLIAESAGVTEKEIHTALPALWEDLGEKNALVRTHYMEVITKLYRENFSYQIGDWCRAHGVLYIGHVIEDSGAHMRMGYGSGHFFRAMDGQDMAGMDIVLIQEIPGVLNEIHRAPIDGWLADPAFFHYTLPKLTASHAHIQPMKQGRAMCELFGAFGWAEGLPYMKAMADGLLVSGINYFVPHAFSPKEEDPDCPPHFYNGGKNIQYPLFKNLMGYMERCSHLLSGATHRADVAVFYNAESEWTGGKYASMDALCKLLTTNLIDFDIIPNDVLQNAVVKDSRLYVNNESYGALIVPESTILPTACLACFAKLAQNGLPVIFPDSYPLRAAEGTDSAVVSTVRQTCQTVSTDRLAAFLREQGLCRMRGEGKNLSYLRSLHMTRGTEEIYLFSNDAIRSEVDVWLTLPSEGEFLIYEPWDNRCYRGVTEEGRVHLHIDGGNMLFLLFGGEIPVQTPIFEVEQERLPLPLRFDISLRDESEDSFRLLAGNSELVDITSLDGYSRFSGEVRYEATLSIPDDYTVLDLGEVGEVAEVWLNGKYMGARINAPYRFDLSEERIAGDNRLEILVKGNLAHRRRDGLSRYLQIPPTGILGELALCRYAPLYKN
ncbi:MAG: hypothetical protein E7668_04515 [Ruminococcaceae bacterium]|nr:hypothetical protein [Oscillospiraceae bacterium]